MTEPVWLSKELITALHERLIAEFGGLAGIRDEGLMESALGRPINRFSYDKPSVCDLAASYAFGIVRNHPFLDGNKRTGFAAAAVFLETNGFRLTATEGEATAATLILRTGGFLKTDTLPGWPKTPKKILLGIEPGNPREGMCRHWRLFIPR